MRSVVSRDREVVPAGAFTLYVHPHLDHPFLNYAIPDGLGEATDLVAEARSRGLVPRLEFVAEACPGVEEELAREGFATERRVPVMACAVGGLNDPGGVPVVVVTAGSELVRPMREVANAAFGDDPPDEAEIARWDGRAVVALEGGEVIGAASWSTVIDGLSEIGGVAVAERFRRRGVGAALTAAASAHAFADGADLAILTPGDEATGRVYARVGFTPVATMVHMRLE
jgi:GNAT superfamily N-acetyltransferase